MKALKHRMSESVIEKYILTFILVLVLFEIVADIFPDVLTSADSLNASGFPLATFFQSGGALWYLVAGALIFMIYKSFKSGK